MKERGEKGRALGRATVGFLYLHITAIKGNEFGSDLLGAASEALLACRGVLASEIMLGHHESGPLRRLFISP